MLMGDQEVDRNTYKSDVYTWNYKLVSELYTLKDLKKKMYRGSRDHKTGCIKSTESDGLKLDRS